MPSDTASPLLSQVVLARPHPGRKSWFIIKAISINENGKKRTRKVLCVVDPRGSVPIDAAGIEDLLFYTCQKKRSEWELPFICLAGPTEELKLTPYNKIPFHASIAMLVEHLREFEPASSSDPKEPSLWGSGNNRLEIHFRKLPRTGMPKTALYIDLS